ncbi:MAG: alanine racemase [Spirochaetaceae bacterium]|jgi:alanine racemase|nr:alanine racemase [Spirochaetaceae bacterium]
MTETRAVVHIDMLWQNIAFIRSLIGNRNLLAPVKADAYGHGAVEVADAALAAGASHLGVARIDEAVELRENDIDAPILLFSIPDPGEIPAAVEYDVTCLVSDRAFADALADRAERRGAYERAGKGPKPVSVHVKIDTGMGRIGVAPEDAPELARYVAGKKMLRLDGVCTHLAVSDSSAPDNIAYTETQIARFTGAVNAIKDAGVNPGIVHAAASGGILHHPASCFNMARPGILLYGYAPGNEDAEKVPVHPVMDLLTKISFLKKVHKGESVSYGRTWVAARDTIVATLPAGYADGLPRVASGKLWFVINGKRYPQVGAICMDQCMVDLGPDPDVRLWDDVVIFGGNRGVGRDSGQADAPLTAASIAEMAGTIPYEILCGIGKRVPRIYLP